MTTKAWPSATPRSRACRPTWAAPTSWCCATTALLTVGKTIADAFLAMYTFENTCRIQIDAQAGGELTQVDPAIIKGVAEASRVQTGGLGGAFVWPSLIRKLDRQGYFVQKLKEKT